MDLSPCQSSCRVFQAMSHRGKSRISSSMANTKTSDRRRLQATRPPVTSWMGRGICALGWLGEDDDKWSCQSCRLALEDGCTINGRTMRFASISVPCKLMRCCTRVGELNYLLEHSQKRDATERSTFDLSSCRSRLIAYFLSHSARGRYLCLSSQLIIQSTIILFAQRDPLL